MKIYALIIGINQYHPGSGVSSLSGCENDVQSMKAFLENKQWFSQKDLHLKTLLNEEATYQNIIDHFGITWLLKAEEGDRVLIHYSGHGAREKAAPEFAPYFPEEKQETIVCYDSRLEGHYDLADKELAVLVERIASKGVEVVLILDCCHSGSGTRNVADFQLGKFRQWDDRNIARPLETYLEGHFKKKMYLPTSKHILLAACEKREKAYELRSCRGSFTTHLLQVLEQSKGNITYANLFAQTRILMRKISDSQTPQIETYGFFNAHNTFLKPDGQRAGASFPMYFKDGEWIVEAGALQGLPAMPDQHAEFEVYEEGRFVGNAITAKVNLNESPLSMELELQEEKALAYTSRLISMPQQQVPVDLQSDETGAKALEEALKSYWPLYFELIDHDPLAPYQLQISDGILQIIRTGDQLTLRTFTSQGQQAFKDIFEHLELLGKWEKTLALKNEQTENRKDVELVLELNYNSNSLTKTSDPEVIIDIFKQNGTEQKVPFRLLAYNHSDSPWNGTLLYLSGNYAIYKMYNDEIPAKKSVVLMDQTSKGKPFAFELKGKNEATDIFKFIASKEKVNDYQLTQTGFILGERIQPHKSIGLEEEEAFEQESFKDWFTMTMTCKVLAQQAKVGAKDIALSNSKIKVLANTSGFEANIALTNSSSDSRSMEENSIISKLIKDSEVEMVNLALTRNVVAPNTLVLSDIQHETQLKNNPLQIELEVNLRDEESILPLTFDGKHILPVGEVAVSADGKVMITIDEVPEIKHRTKSLTKALKLCFLKLIFKSKNIQQLCRVDYSQPKANRISDGVEVKVQQAENILLLIHGIIGDTKGMVECMRQAYDDQTFDLVLSFDYENLNTPIEETANALDEKLKMAGITLDNGKQITILAHSMGGLVSRFFIEKLGGNQVVKHLILAGTPNAGSAIAKITKYRGISMALIGFAINSIGGIPTAASLLAVLKQSQKLTPTLEQMNGDKDFIKRLNKSSNPNIPYSIIAGHLDQYLEKNKNARLLMDKLYKLGGKAFYGKQSNDLAVSVKSILSVPQKWQPAIKEVACHHLNYFEETKAVETLYELL